MNEMKKLLEQKQAFNLIDKRVKIKCQIPKFMFAYAYDDKTTTEEQDDKFQEEYNKIGEPFYFIKLKKNSSKLLDL